MRGVRRQPWKRHKNRLYRLPAQDMRSNGGRAGSRVAQKQVMTRPRSMRFCSGCWLPDGVSTVSMKPLYPQYTISKVVRSLTLKFGCMQFRGHLMATRLVPFADDSFVPEDSIKHN